MRRFFPLIAVCFGLVAAGTFAGESYVTPGGGYGYRSSGYSYYTHPNGTTQTWTGTGSTRFYSDSTGTTGTSIYGSGGRFDSYTNGRQGWSGSGYTPYSTPGYSTYRRSYYSTPSYSTPSYGGYGTRYGY